MKLELKHLAPYLPYRLTYHLPLESERYESIMENEPFKLALPFMDETEKSKHFDKYIKMYLYQEKPQIMWDNNRLFLGQMVSNLGFDEDDVYLDEVKPILRSMEDIKYYVDFLNTYYVDFNKIEGCLVKRKNENFTRLNELDFLFKNHFDVFGLIEKGLAVDINTLSVE